MHTNYWKSKAQKLHDENKALKARYVNECKCSGNYLLLTLAGWGLFVVSLLW